MCHNLTYEWNYIKPLSLSANRNASRIRGIRISETRRADSDETLRSSLRHKGGGHPECRHTKTSQEGYSHNNVSSLFCQYNFPYSVTYRDSVFFCIEFQYWEVIFFVFLHRHVVAGQLSTLRWTVNMCDELVDERVRVFELLKESEKHRKRATDIVNLRQTMNSYSVTAKSTLIEVNSWSFSV